jgi:4-amino-4-deoxy-L-arabinose transferase-like glycosyltransferase
MSRFFERVDPAARVVLLLILVAFVLRFATLDMKSIWLDEAVSLVMAANFTSEEMWSVFRDTRHPAGYYWMLRQAIQATGTELWQLRLPSALFSLASFGLLFLLARRLFPGRQKLLLIALSLYALSPLDFWYAQEARMYAAVTMLGLLIALGLALNHPAGSLLVYAGLAAGLVTNYTLIPLWVGLSAVWLVYWWQQGRKPLPLLFNIVAMGAAWWAFHPYYYHLDQLLRDLNTVTLFDRVQTTLGVPEASGGIYIVLLAGGGLILLLIGIAGRWLLRHPRWRAILAPPILLGIIACLLVLAAPRLYTAKRILVTGWPYVVLMGAWLIDAYGQAGQERVRRRWWQALAAVSALSLLITILTPKDDWRGLVAYVNQSLDSNSILKIDPHYNDQPYNYYEPVTPARDEQLNELAAQHEEIWLISERVGSATISQSEQWLDRNWQLVGREQFHRIELRHYQAPQ